MVAKKKVVDEPMNKKARAALARKMKGETFQASGELNRVYSLADGEYTRILDTRKDCSYHLKVGSDKYHTVVTELLETNHGDRIRQELLDLGFPLPLERDD